MKRNDMPMRRGDRERPEDLEDGSREDCCEDTCGSLLESFREACTDPALSDLMRNAGLFSVQAAITELEPE